MRTCLKKLFAYIRSSLGLIEEIDETPLVYDRPPLHVIDGELKPGDKQ